MEILSHSKLNFSTNVLIGTPIYTTQLIVAIRGLNNDQITEMICPLIASISAFNFDYARMSLILHPPPPPPTIFFCPLQGVAIVRDLNRHQQLFSNKLEATNKLRTFASQAKEKQKQLEAILKLAHIKASKSEKENKVLQSSTILNLGLLCSLSLDLIGCM